jgi:phosphoenolpyruvate carboxykinase (diphosphate)
MTPPKIDLVRSTGLNSEGGQAAVMDRSALQRSIAVKLAANGFGIPNDGLDADVLELAGDLFSVYREQSRLLQDHYCPIDQRIQSFLDQVLAPVVDERVQLPRRTIAVDRYGLARELSFPRSRREFHNSEIDSYRLSKGGVLHNPVNDKRTTKGVFHVADYGLPVPADKIAVPLVTYGRLLKAAIDDVPTELLQLPYTCDWDEPVETMVSLVLRPVVCPEVPGVRPEKRMEIRFFVPGCGARGGSEFA